MGDDKWEEFGERGDEHFSFTKIPMTLKLLTFISCQADCKMWNEVVSCFHVLDEWKNLEQNKISSCLVSSNEKQQSHS